MTIEQVGEVLKGNFIGARHPEATADSPTVPVNVKDRDVFHLTIEEYLQSLISLIDELVRGLFAVSHYYADPWLNRLVLRATR